ncbi:alpha/beta fold hydrolase [Streptomyces sp. NPDC056987]|uniref:alpha/beta fold hydrolase n=1 Tax=Streptomyces sp. NPDC056987 TaxID=3345988 RepID=UPI00362775A0
MATSNLRETLPGVSRVATRFGRVSVFDNHSDRNLGGGVPLLFVHGNSVSQRVFQGQLAGDFGPRRLLAVDLLGHGESDDAADPFAAYTHEGYADTLIEVLDALAVERVVVIGWSLGGYIGYELAAKHSGVAALITVGTPPVNHETLFQGFLNNPTFEYIGQEVLTAEQAVEMAEQSTVTPAPGDITANVVRADGRARKRMFDSLMAGEGQDKRQLSLTPPVPLGIIDGADDPFVNREYVDALPFSALWRSAPVRIPDTRHAPFFEKPAEFNDLVRGFLIDHNL